MADIRQIDIEGTSLSQYGIEDTVARAAAKTNSDNIENIKSDVDVLKSNTYVNSVNGQDGDIDLTNVYAEKEHITKNASESELGHIKITNDLSNTNSDTAITPKGVKEKIDLVDSDIEKIKTDISTLSSKIGTNCVKSVNGVFPDTTGKVTVTLENINCEGYENAQEAVNYLEDKINDFSQTVTVNSKLIEDKHYIQSITITDAEDNSNTYNNTLVQANAIVSVDTPELSSLKINDIVYKIVAGGGGGEGTTVVANPTGDPIDDLNKIKIGNDIYKIPTNEIEPNPDETAAVNLTKMKIDGVVYNITGGGGEGGTSNYDELNNRPKIAGVLLTGDKSLSDLGINNFDGDYENLTNKPDKFTPKEHSHVMRDITDLEVGDKVSVSSTGTSTEEAKYITINDIQYKLAGSGGGTEVSVSASATPTEDEKAKYITIDDKTWAIASGGEGGTSDYDELDNKPKINNVILSGDKTSIDLGLVSISQGKTNKDKILKVNEDGNLELVEDTSNVNVSIPDYTKTASLSTDKLSLNDTVYQLTNSNNYYSMGTYDSYGGETIEFTSSKKITRTGEGLAKIFYLNASEYSGYAIVADNQEVFSTFESIGTGEGGLYEVPSTFTRNGKTLYIAHMLQKEYRGGTNLKIYNNSSTGKPIKVIDYIKYMVNAEELEYTITNIDKNFLNYCFDFFYGLSQIEVESDIDSISPTVSTDRISVNDITYAFDGLNSYYNKGTYDSFGEESIMSQGRGFTRESGELAKIFYMTNNNTWSGYGIITASEDIFSNITKTSFGDLTDTASFEREGKTLYAAVMRYAWSGNPPIEITNKSTGKIIKRLTNDYSIKVTADDLNLNKIDEDFLNYCFEYFYGIKSSSGTEIEPNPIEEATEVLESIKINDTIYSLPNGEGTDIITNPDKLSDEDMYKIQIGNKVYRVNSKDYDYYKKYIYVSRPGEITGAECGGRRFLRNEDNTTSIIIFGVHTSTGYNGFAAAFTDEEDLTKYNYNTTWANLVRQTTYHKDNKNLTIGYMAGMFTDYEVKATDGIETKKVFPPDDLIFAFDEGGTTPYTLETDFIEFLFETMYGKNNLGGSIVVANPEDTVTETLTSIKIDDIVYQIEGGSTEPTPTTYKFNLLDKVDSKQYTYNITDIKNNKVYIAPIFSGYVEELIEIDFKSKTIEMASNVKLDKASKILNLTSTPSRSDTRCLKITDVNYNFYWKNGSDHTTVSIVFSDNYKTLTIDTGSNSVYSAIFYDEPIYSNKIELTQEEYNELVNNDEVIKDIEYWITDSDYSGGGSINTNYYGIIPPMGVNEEEIGIASTDLGFTRNLDDWPRTVATDLAFIPFKGSFDFMGLTEYADDNIQRNIRLDFYKNQFIKEIEVYYRTAAEASGFYVYLLSKDDEWIEVGNALNKISKYNKKEKIVLSEKFEAKALKVVTEGGSSNKRMVISNIRIK